MVRLRVLLKTLLALVLLVAFSLPARSEEFVLKDGTTITGRMVSIKGDTIEIQTQYGKIKVKRSDIVTINFPENQPALPAEAAPAAPEAPPLVEHSLEGTKYTNRTGNFTLTVPPGWKISEEVRASSGGAIAALVTPNDDLFLIVTQEKFHGSLQAYKEVVELQWNNQVANYEKLSDTEITVNNEPATLIVFRGMMETPQRLPVKFLVAIVNEGDITTRLMAWCIEPLFKESRKTLEEIILSYQTLRDSPLAPN